jgi:uncharacterized protein YkwD
MRLQLPGFLRTSKWWALPIWVALWTPAVLLAQKPAPAPTTPSVEPAKADPIVTQLVDGHNKERTKAGLTPLKLEPRLTEAAKAHAKDMADHEFMAHEGSDESSPAERVTRTGYRYRSTGENVAKGYRGVDEVIQVWMESPPHKKNVLGDYTEIGVAVAYGKDEKPYWCTEFGKPIPVFDPVTAADDLVKRINEERLSEKLPPLTIDPKLVKAAREQATKMARNKSQGGGTATMEGIDQSLYTELAVSTAGGHTDAESMVTALMDNAGLKSQILGKFARIGTGYAAAENGTPYWSLILANPARSTKKSGRQ